MDWKDMAGKAMRVTSLLPKDRGNPPVHLISCAFCAAKQGYESNVLTERDLGGNRRLYNFSLKCNNCGNINFATFERWADGTQSIYTGFTFKFVRYPLEKSQLFDIHSSWPPHIARFFSQAVKALETNSWDSALLMSRSTLQTLAREKGAQGKNLKEEIDDLGSKGLIVQSMVKWSHHIRTIANESAHPKSTDSEPTEQEAREIVKFTHFMLELLITIPATAPASTLPVNP